MNIARRIALPALALLALAACSSPQPVDLDATAAQLEARSDALADSFQQQLQAALLGAMADGAPASAIGVCAEVAPAIATQLSAQSGALARRTALRARNPAAVPDATERRVMEQWLGTALDAGDRPRRWGGWEGADYRYLRAIPTAPMCLSCHGGELAPDVAAALRERYPADEATGFAVGQLRGAFSIRWPDAARGR